jgi:hypothetical protein
MRAHRHDPHERDYEEIQREREVQDAMEQSETPRLLQLVKDLAERDYALRAEGRRYEADTLFMILEGLRMDLGWREVTPQAEKDLRARWIGQAS